MRWGTQTSMPKPASMLGQNPKWHYYMQCSDSFCRISTKALNHSLRSVVSWMVQMVSCRCTKYTAVDFQRWYLLHWRNAQGCNWATSSDFQIVKSKHLMLVACIHNGIRTCVYWQLRCWCVNGKDVKLVGVPRADCDTFHCISRVKNKRNE